MNNSVYLLRTAERDISINLQYGFRKRLTLTVYPDQKIVARIPYGFPKRKIEEYFKKKTRWMLKHLDHFEQHPPESEKKYIEGEIHKYLGKEYSLKLEHGASKVSLDENGLILRVKDINDTEIKKRVLDSWYRKQAVRVLTPLFDQWMERLQYLKLPKTSLRYYKMKRRWGSCSAKGTITLNTELIRKDKTLIDYVIVHEICHLKVPAHNKEFYNLVGSVMPDWKKRRSTLNNGR